MESIPLPEPFDSQIDEAPDAFKKEQGAVWGQPHNETGDCFARAVRRFQANEQVVIKEVARALRFTLGLPNTMTDYEVEHGAHGAVWRTINTFLRGAAHHRVDLDIINGKEETT